MRRLCPVVLLAAVLRAAAAGAQPLSADDIFGPPRGVHIESIQARYTHFDQDGRGYQSRATPHGEPITTRGSEEAHVEHPQVEVVARQGERLVHRILIPVDVVTAASPVHDPRGIDAISAASRVNVAGSINILSTYQLGQKSTLSFRAGVHMEENFRSWVLGAGGSRSLAEDNTVISASVVQVVDWFDKYDYGGEKIGRVFRSSTNGNLGVTQLLSPWTVAHLGYGVTVQTGELSNTWNSVPLLDGGRALERLPGLRQRHAFVLRLAQVLPWQGAVKATYRFYADDWDIRANTVEFELYQRVSPQLYLRASYRLHQQTAAGFFTSAAPRDAPLMTADSDLEDFLAHTFGVRAAFDVPLRRPRGLALDVGYERYLRSNSLHANIYSCSLGLRF